MGIFINSLSHSYDGNVKVLKEINCVIDEHKITTIFGPSGCGKTTLLNILAGIVNPTSGMVKIDNTDITTVPVQKRNVGYVFQDYALYPNMSVYDNISFPLQSKKISKTVIWEKVHQLAKTLHIEEHLSKKPSMLSGGQKQRVAIARALIKQPEFLLMDEPFANLDAELAVELQEEFKKIQQYTQSTTLYVTHNRNEALSISDKIVVMNEGRIIQIGTPSEIYAEPNNIFVAKAFSSAYGIVNAKIENGALIFNETVIDSMTADGYGGDVLMLLRPCAVDFNESACSFPAVVTSVKYLGDQYQISLCVNECNLIAFSDNDKEIGKDVRISLDVQKIYIFSAVTGDRIL